MSLQGPNSLTNTTTNVGVAIPIVSSSVPANRVDIQALYSNVANIYIGGPTINGSNRGIELVPGQVYNIEKITDLFPIFMVATNSGDGISINYWTGETS